jgi:hypothetical protein
MLDIFTRDFHFLSVDPNCSNGCSSPPAAGAAYAAASTQGVPRRKFGAAHAGSGWYDIWAGDVVRHVAYIREGGHAEDLWY